MNETNQQQPLTPDPAPAAPPRSGSGKTITSFLGGLFTGVLSTLIVMALVITVIGVLYIGVSRGGSQRAGTGSNSDAKLSELEGLIDTYFYEDADDEALRDGIYKGFVEGLDDPYSQYYTEEEYKEYEIDTMGNYAGIGALLTQNENTKAVYIVKVYKDSPAEKAGLKAGDEIISADGHKAKDEDLDSFVHRIRGDAGTELKMVYARKGDKKTVTITRAEISVPTVEHEMVDEKNKVGLVEISSFDSNTKDDFDEAMADLRRQGMKSVIFDLRSNPGGLVDSVTQILDEILPKGTTVYMLDKNGKKETYTSDNAHVMDYPIAVLTSENTASAAEIFAGAIRDFHYGTLIGTKTYGKGVVQATYPLTDGSAVKLTIATYYTPSGECIHKKGIKPDIKLKYKYSGKDGEDYDYSKDNQVQKAIKVLTK